MTESLHLNELRVWSMTNLGDLYRQNGRYREAETLLRQALASAEQVFGPNDANVSVILNNLAVLYKYIGEFDEAERLYKWALATIERQTEVDDEKVATLYHNLGGLEHAWCRYAEGEALARRAVQLRERALGPNHVDVAADLAALAALLDGQGKHNESEPLYRRALSIFERTYGAEHYEIAVNLNNLGAAAAARGRTGEVEQSYQRALQIKEKLLGPEHPDVAITLNNLATLRIYQQRFTEAATMYERALAIFRQVFGPTDPRVVACEKNYRCVLPEPERQEPQRHRDTKGALSVHALRFLQSGPRQPFVSVSLWFLTLVTRTVQARGAARLWRGVDRGAQCERSGRALWPFPLRSNLRNTAFRSPVPKIQPPGRGRRGRVSTPESPRGRSPVSWLLAGSASRRSRLDRYACCCRLHASVQLEPEHDRQEPVASRGKQPRGNEFAR